jgi:zinc transport system ATP-binding protein
MQRVFIARALVGEPRLLFLDEPTVGLDAVSLDKLNGLLKRLNSEMGLTMVMVTHDLSLIIEITNKIACLKNQTLYVHDPKDFTHEEDFFREVFSCDRHPHYHSHSRDFTV